MNQNESKITENEEKKREINQISMNEETIVRYIKINIKKKEKYQRIIVYLQYVTNHYKQLYS